MDMATMDEKKATGVAVSGAAVEIQAGEVSKPIDVQGLDEAEIFLRDSNIGHRDLDELLQDEASMKKLVRKVDGMLMPLLYGTYLLQYIDKQSLSYAAVFDLFETTNTNQNQYSWLVSLFYFGYLVAEWPMSYLAQKLPTGRVISITIIIWGGILMLMAACQSFAGLAIWLLFLFVLLNETVNGGLANFAKLIIEDLAAGDALRTTAYGIPTGAWQVLFVFSGPWLAGKFTNIRTYVMAAYIIPTIIATALLWRLPHAAEHNKGLLICCYIAGSYVASLVIALQLPTNNVAGYSKRVSSTAAVFLAYCAGNIIGPHAFIESEAPFYPTGCTVTMACAAGQVVLCFVIRAVLIRRNKRRDALCGPVSSGATLAEGPIEDITDFENPNFRYSY